MPKEIRPFRADLAPMVVALPTEDRQRSFNFYAEGLGLEPIGETAEDGIPEPLQFVLNQGVRLMLIPTGGFRLGDRQPPDRGTRGQRVSLGAARRRRAPCRRACRTGSSGRG